MHNDENIDEDQLLNVYSQLSSELFRWDISYPVPELVVTADYLPARLGKDPHFVDRCMLITDLSKLEDGSLIWILLDSLVDCLRIDA